MNAPDAADTNDDNETVVIGHGLAVQIVEKLDNLTAAVKDLAGEHRAVHLEIGRSVAVQEAWQGMARGIGELLYKAGSSRIGQIVSGVSFAVFLLKFGGEEARWAITFTCQVLASSVGWTCPTVP